MTQGDGPHPSQGAAISAVLKPAGPGDEQFLTKVLSQAGTLSVSSSLIALIGAAFKFDAAKIALIGLIVLIALYIAIYRDFVSQKLKSYMVLLLLCAIALFVVLGWDFAAEGFEKSIARKYATEEAGLSKATGIIRYTPHANDFLPELSKYIDGASQEIWFTGVSFYLTLPQHKERLLAALDRGVDVKILIYNPLSPNLAEIANGFSQTPRELAGESDVTIENLRSMVKAWAGRRKGTARFEVRLFSQVPRARLYMFDRRSEAGFTYFIPHVDDRNTPNLPGFLIRNVKTGVGPAYFEGVESVWQRSVPFEEFLLEYDRTRQQSSQVSQPDRPSEGR